MFDYTLKLGERFKLGELTVPYDCLELTDFLTVLSSAGKCTIDLHMKCHDLTNNQSAV